MFLLCYPDELLVTLQRKSVEVESWQRLQLFEVPLKGGVLWLRLKSWDDWHLPDSCLFAFFSSTACSVWPVIFPPTFSLAGPSEQNALYIYPFYFSSLQCLIIWVYILWLSTWSHQIFFWGESINKGCSKFFLLKSIAFIN